MCDCRQKNDGRAFCNISLAGLEDDPVAMIIWQFVVPAAFFFIQATKYPVCSS
jgi:hypothetical protein